MKKQLLGFAAISLLFGASSCTQEDFESVNDGKNAIEFKTVLGKQTRATEVDISNLQTDGLTVYSYYTGTGTGAATAFNTFTLTYDNINSKWVYTGSKDQPGTLLRYYSVYPEDDVTNRTATATTYSFDYTVPTAAASQIDLIAATNTTSSSTVNLPFKHLLSQVNFAVQGILGVKIEISDIKVSPAKGGGTYTFSGTPGWGTLTNTSAPYEYPVLASAAATLAGAASTNQEKLMDVDGALMLMPQAFTSATDGTFSFKFSLTTDTNGDGDIDTGDTPTVDDATVVVNLCDFNAQGWVAGTSYLYLIDFTSYLAGGPITFTVAVAPWVDNGNGNPLVSETLHVADATLTSIKTAIAKHSTTNAGNTNLSIFPIAVEKTLSSAIEIDAITGFDQNDEIRIELPDATTIDNLTCTASGWTRTVVDSRVVVLTKD